MASNNPKMSRQGTAGRRKHITLTIHLKLGIIWGPENGERWRAVMASFNNGLSTIYEIQQWNTQLQSFTATSESVKYLFKWQTLQGPKLAQQKPMAGPMIIEKAKYFYNEMKITDKCTFSGCWLQNFKETAAEGDLQTEYSSEWLWNASTGAVTKNYLWELRLIQVL